MTIALEHITIPAWSTVGYGIGTDEHGNAVRFVGDHRPLRHLGEALAGATGPITIEIEDWQIVSVEEARG